MLKTRTKKRAWNKDETVRQRRPFTPREVQVMRYAIEREQNGRDLALFNTAMDTMLRSSNLLALKVPSKWRMRPIPWARYAWLALRDYSTHRLRRTKSSMVYEKTRNLAACRELLGHKSISSTAAYLGVDERQALDLAKKIEV